MTVKVRFVALVLILFISVKVRADETDLKASGPNTLGQKVDVRVEIRGNVSPDFDGQSSTDLPMKVDGHFVYRERQLHSQQSVRHIRHYETAQATIDYGRGQEVSKLARGNDWIIADRKVNPEQPKRMRFLTSTAGLTQAELDLLTIPASTLVWDRMLETSKASLGTKWTPNDDLLADVLLIDKVQENGVEMTLTQIQNGIATVTISGKAAGTIDDAEADIQIQGTCQFDLNAGYTRNVQLTLREDRSICASAPGYDAVTKLELQVTRPSNDLLPQSEIDTAGLNQRKWTDFLVLHSDLENFRLRHDRRWRLISNQGETALMRYIEGTLLLAQCTIQSLKPLGSPDDYTLDAFRADVAKTTAQKGEISNATNFVTAKGLSVMQVDVTGKVDDVDVTWRYYHLTQPDGQRVTFVVTFDTEIASRFEGVDRRLIDSVEFLRAADNSIRATNASATQSK
jgi:hypothetical protein